MTKKPSENIPELIEETPTGNIYRMEAPKIDYTSAELYDAVFALQVACHYAQVKAGWHTSLKTGQQFTREEQDEKFPTRIALCHSELSEALEAHRKGMRDDKLPHRDGATVELADALIRIFDLAGCLGLDLPGALVEKMEYNAKRADHKIANRKEAGGKAY